MKKIITAIIILVLVLSACGNKNQQAKVYGPENRMAVVATIGMIGDVAANIGGERVSVYSMMGPGVDPHLYRAKANDVTRLRQADLILYNGLHLEAKMGDILEKLSGTQPAYAVSEGIPDEELLHMGEHTIDPHVWFDVSKWQLTAGAILAALQEVDPAGSDYYKKNYDAYNGEIEELDKYVKAQVREIPENKRTLITAHDAFNYFGKAYGFEVLGIQGISTVDEAGTSDIRKLADYIVEHEIGAIFVESSVSSKNLEALQAAVQARGFEVRIGGELFSDAMGSAGTEEGTYLGMVKHNVDTIVHGLGGK
ncbi:MAG: zinc ABC transporter substrate-binding protein [Spirochaetales bacterium]|nr:zinc ABC transporter substrate-binding protein [Spirochaetales bacterium]